MPAGCLQKKIKLLLNAQHHDSLSDGKKKILIEIQGNVSTNGITNAGKHFTFFNFAIQ